MRKTTLKQDLVGLAIGTTIGQGLLLIQDKGLSKEDRLKLHASGMVGSLLCGGAAVAANAINRKVTSKIFEK